jgi:hypothetical protein
MSQRRLNLSLAVAAGAWAVAAILAAPAAWADNPAEDALKRFFEGRRVVVLIDMPATSSGVDVYPEREYPLDFAKVGDRVRGSGVSLREGDRTTVTRVKLKDDLIEFQLGGGGFNNFKDASAKVSTSNVPKSSRERDLEREVRAETDPARKRRLQRELDDERRDREREQSYRRQRDEEINEERREQDRRRALDMGSRFNVRFEKKDVPAAYKTPEGLMRALEKFVDFQGLGPRPPERPEDLVSESAPPADASAGRGAVRKGMSRADVEALYGAPLRQDRNREGALDVLVAAYEKGRDRVEVTYVDEVVVRVAPLQPR